MGCLSVRSAVALFAAAGSVVLLGGCGDSAAVSNPGGSSSATTAPLVQGGAGSVYAAVDNSIPVVVKYGATTSGTSIPTGSVNITASTDVDAIAIDKNTGTLYVTGFSYTDNQPEIWAYAGGVTSGSPTPTRTIMMGLTSTTEPNDLTVDSAGNVYVAVSDTNSGLGTVLEYSATATGAATPLKQLSGSATGIITPISLAVDSANTLYVSSVSGTNIYQGSILEFSSGQNGNATPVQTITNSSAFYYGIAVDANLNLYGTQGTGVPGYGVNTGSTIVKFAPGATGKASPTTTIVSPAAGVLSGIRVDSVGNIFVLNQTSANAYGILGFGPTASGYSNPAVTLAPVALNGNTTSSIAIQ